MAADIRRSGWRYPSAAIITLVFCFCIAVIEGIDLQSMGIAAPKLRPEFHLSADQLANVLLASPLGLFFGAFIGGRLADSWGRKAVLALSIAIFGAFQLTTIWAPNYSLLLAIRLACGLGLGGALPNLIALTSEAGAGRNSILNVVITAAGMPIGGALASYVTYLGGETGNWRTVFYIGGIAPLVLTPILAVALPESGLFRNIRAEGVETDAKTHTGSTLFGDGRWAATLLLWAAFFGTTLVTYLLLNWLPSLMVAKGFSRTDASVIQLWFNIGSAIGSICLGWLMQSWPGRRVLLACYVGLAAFLYVLTQAGHSVTLACASAAVVGGFLLGAQFLLYALSPSFYLRRARATGAGAAVAAGRLGSIAAPKLGGLLLVAGATVGQVLQTLLPVTAAAALAAMLLMFCRREPVNH